MSQETRFVDITRSFLPADPNSFPDGLHEVPKYENRLPITAYQGHNFLPTAYGYKSYFGTTSRLEASALPGLADYVFVFQNASLQNILIALCDTGIWYKAGSTAGGWTQIHVEDAYVEGGFYYPWSFAIVNDELYCYRMNNTNYQKIVSSASAPGFTMTSVVPSFLNMAGQLGIFRAGNRLGFWDSEDSISWSNLDDLADFTPSLETLAGNAVFSQVLGRIVNIIGHGEGFMVYSTKGIVYVQEAPESLYQWDPTRIFDAAGISYRRQVTASVPDNTHYVYTGVGFYKIKNGVPELIVPAVTDYFKLDPSPKFLRFLEGRYLFIQTLDPDFANGIPQFSDEVIPDTIITLPGANLDLADAVADASTKGSAGFCPILSGLGNGSFSQPEDAEEGKLYRPVYTAFLSRGGAKATDIAWQTTPCSIASATGEAIGMSPGSAGTADILSTDETNKTEVSGAEAYTSGGWTITRFVAAQSALWEIEQQNLQAFIAAVLGRGHSSTTTTRSAVAINDETDLGCLVGEFVSQWSSPQFGFSACEFWLTRWALQTIEVKAVGKRTRSSVLIPASVQSANVYGWYAADTYTGPVYPTANEAARVYWDASNGAGSYVSLGMYLTYSANNPPGFPGANLAPVTATITHPGGALTVYFIRAASYDAVAPLVNGGGASANPSWYDNPEHYDVTVNVFAHNKATDVSNVPIPETAFLKLTGWDDGTTITAAASCSAPTAYPAGSTNREAPPALLPIIGKDGTFCSEPFEPFVIPGTPDVTIEWPEQVVTLPGGTFLLQNGAAEPIYPTYEGAHVYDTHLEKWGKYKGRHRQLLDYSPINTYGPSDQSYRKFGIMGGILTEGGYLELFDEYPTSSSITYGKFGYYRQGVTSVEEFHVHMRIPCTGTLTVETSLEGKNLSVGLSKTSAFTDETKWLLTGAYPGRWHNLRIDGLFDISYLEYRGNPKGKR